MDQKIYKWCVVGLHSDADQIVADEVEAHDVVRSHCACCGLRRVERTTGSQRNPGETDTVEYEWDDELAELNSAKEET